MLAIRIGGGDFRLAGVDPERVFGAGETIEAAIAIENLHFFDAQSGAALR